MVLHIASHFAVEGLRHYLMLLKGVQDIKMYSFIGT